MVVRVSPLHKQEVSLCGLPVFAAVRIKVSRAFLSRPNAAALAALVKLDPALTAELLAAANSPALGQGLQVYTALEAIRLLGWDETERIITLAFEAQAKFRADIHGVVRAHWAHSLACAVIASQVAPIFALQEDRAFAFGLLHDVGALGLMATSPGAYCQVFHQGSHSCIEKLGAEECMMGIDHCQAGSWLLNSWGLPAEFAEGARNHHETALDGSRNLTTPVTPLVTLACRYADAVGYPVGHSGRVSLRDATRTAPPHLVPGLRAAEAVIARKCQAAMLEYAHEFDGETAKAATRS